MRKVLSFVLVLALVLSSFSMAFAADSAAASLTDIAGNANEDAIQVCFDLGIVTGNPDGTFLPEKAVTRAEFAAMLTRALDIPASALAGYTTTSFKDTTGYSWAVSYLAFSQSKGVLLGDGAGNVMPGKTITVNEAMTMALRAIGYTANSALLVGSWPSNYVSIAQNADLYDNVAATSTVDKASAAQIIYNLLTVQKVAVNSDGSTEYLWDGKEADGVEANLLNTNLGCEESADVILGSDYTYEDAIINITDDIGAYGTAYLNSDDELVAFTKDSTALTGKLNTALDTFEVGDVDYDISNADNDFATDPAFFANADDTVSASKITVAGIAAWAAANADDGDTVTLNVDLSGKKIKDIYSVVAWETTTADLAASDVQEDIADGSLLASDFVLDDNDDIDNNSFGLYGVASLDKIAEDNVVYVYEDAAGDIRKVEVGTETVDGIVEETDDDNTVTVAGKDYDLAANAVVAIPADIDVDSDGIFYLDVNGEIYDFDGTGTTDTYAVVKSFSETDGFSNSKYKLYKSDDSTSTLYFAEDNDADMDWTTDGAASIAAVKTTGALIGYSLNADGDIDTINNSKTTTTNSEVKSAKVIYIGGVAKTVESDAVVFTYEDAITDATTYDVAALADLDAGVVSGAASYILNDDGKIAAMLLDYSNVSVDDTDVYAVLNTRTSTKTGDDEVYKFVGFIDGTAFTKKTDDRTGFPAAGTFDVYKVTVDTNDVITAAASLNATLFVKDTNSGYVVKSAVLTEVSSDRTVLTVGANKYTVADDAVVYKYNDTDEEFTVSKLSSLKVDYTVSLFDTEGEDADGVADVVIYMED